MKFVIAIDMYLAQGPYYISTPLYSNTSLFQEMEMTPIKSEFHKFLLRTIIFPPTFHYLGISLLQFSLTPFPQRKLKTNVFFSWKKIIQKLLKDKSHKISKQSPTDI